MESVIRLDQLTKTGRRRGLAGLSLDIARGEVFGYLGPNGAGKSTTIRLLVDLIRPTGGTVRVLGSDPRSDAVAPQRRIGYLAGDFVVDTRQTVDDCLTFLPNLRGGIARTRIAGLTERLDLDLGARIKTLSKGNQQKVGLVQAFMHQPELTSGLDPLVQQTFLQLVTETRAAGVHVLAHHERGRTGRRPGRHHPRRPTDHLRHRGRDVCELLSPSSQVAPWPTSWPTFPRHCGMPSGSTTSPRRRATCSPPPSGCRSRC
ncbi:ABC transporter ATP-binding protein [Amycolatopsis sp. H20-H5]|uniref:ABC transporter ATP-binding protein n=1 Tax=Amycolatopsis sp. H20-H5 TaxID=3046309 RepID=UPI002DB87594|nr:ABC transporter ATP-binding protein [Amycolatopsis sp. H20-H5]MEC3975811.1 ABC transporter ATP-binding protein [Amycolatopsis sp. H20-H5]